MIFRSSTHRPSCALAALGVLAACNSGGVGNGTPVINQIPPQIGPGGASVSLDLDPYVSDREGDALTYAVAAAGGSFTGSVYAHTFATMGDYTVGFTVTDAVGNVANGSFDVTVTTANLAAVQEGTTGLLLLDTFSNEMLSVAASTSAPRFAAGLPDGRLVYQRATGQNQQLHVFDPFTRGTRLVAPASATYVTFRAATSTGRIVFTTGAAPDTDLFAFDPRTNLLTEVSATAGEVDGNPLVNGADLVFFERGASGQRDIWYFDPAGNSSTPVSANANDEQLLAVLSDGAAVFARVGAGGETDLHWFRQGTGLVEIGLDIPGLDARHKTYGGGGSGGQVVFTAQNGADVDLYSWNPANGTTTAIATGGVFGFAAIGAGNEVVYRQEVSAGEHDLFFRDLDDGAAGTVRNAADVGSVLAMAGDGTTNWAFVQGSSATSSISAVSLVAAPATVTWNAGGAAAVGGVLANGDVVVQRTDGTALQRFDVSAGAFGAAVAGAGLAFAGAGLEDGDFVYTLSVAAQLDLSMWDESAAAPVVVSSTAGDDEFQAATADGTLLFTRVITGNTNADLFAWHPVGGEQQLTAGGGAGTSQDYSVSGKYGGSR